MYAGAEVAISSLRRAEGKPPPGPENEVENKNADEDSGDEEDWGVTMGEQLVESENEVEGEEQPITSDQSSMPIAVAQTAGQEWQTSLAIKLAIQKLKQTVCWLEAEISRLRGGRDPKCR